MRELEKLLEDFRSWNFKWSSYQNGYNRSNPKPKTKDEFLKDLYKKYNVIKKDINE